MLASAGGQGKEGAMEARTVFLDGEGQYEANSAQEGAGTERGSA